MLPDEFWGSTQFQLQLMATQHKELVKEEWLKVRAGEWWNAVFVRAKRMPSWEEFVLHDYPELQKKIIDDKFDRNKDFVERMIEQKAKDARRETR